MELRFTEFQRNVLYLQLDFTASEVIPLCSPYNLLPKFALLLTAESKYMWQRDCRGCDSHQEWPHFKFSTNDVSSVT